MQHLKKNQTKELKPTNTEKPLTASFTPVDHSEFLYFLCFRNWKTTYIPGLPLFSAEPLQKSLQGPSRAGFGNKSQILWLLYSPCVLIPTGLSHPGWGNHSSAAAQPVQLGWSKEHPSDINNKTCKRHKL